MKHRLVGLMAPPRGWSAWKIWAALTAAALPLAAAGCSSSNTSPPPTAGAGAATSGGGAAGVGVSGTPGGGTPVGAGATGAGATGATGAGANSGLVTFDGGTIVNPKVDPTISFNWPVDDPNPAGLTCQPGHYSGAFLGLYTSPITVVGVPIPVTGDVQLTLAQSTNGEFFTVTNGFVTGRADILAEYRCGFFGTLNCTTKKLENGYIDCKYCVGAYALDGGLCLGLESHFIGPLTADYNATSQAFENGTWKGKEGADAGVFGGLGIWTATYMP